MRPVAAPSRFVAMVGPAPAVWQRMLRLGMSLSRQEQLNRLESSINGETRIFPRLLTNPLFDPLLGNQIFRREWVL